MGMSHQLRYTVDLRHIVGSQLNFFQFLHGGIRCSKSYFIRFQIRLLWYYIRNYYVLHALFTIYTVHMYMFQSLAYIRTYVHTVNLFCTVDNYNLVLLVEMMHLQ